MLTFAINDNGSYLLLKKCTNDTIGQTIIRMFSESRFFVANAPLSSLVELKALRIVKTLHRLIKLCRIFIQSLYAKFSSEKCKVYSILKNDDELMLMNFHLHSK